MTGRDERLILAICAVILAALFAFVTARDSFAAARVSATVTDGAQVFLDCGESWSDVDVRSATGRRFAQVRTSYGYRHRLGSRLVRTYSREGYIVAESVRGLARVSLYCESEA